MAETTIVNTPPIQAIQDNGAGWAVALVIALAVIVGGFVWYRYYSPYMASAPTTTTNNVNVTVPTPKADVGVPGVKASGATTY